MAYFIQSKKSDVRLTYLPKTTVLRSGRKVVLDYYDEKYEAEVHAILRYIVNEEGNSYPQDDMVDIEAFRRYYLSHEVFVCTDAQTDEVLGAFYIKPNFPGRCSHICNAGFIVKASERGQGIGHMMAENYLYMARDLGYKASFFNLVFVSNEASIYLWRKLGFKEIGRVPNAGNLKGIGYTDAIQFYYDFTNLGETK